MMTRSDSSSKLLVAATSAAIAVACSTSRGDFGEPPPPPSPFADASSPVDPSCQVVRCSRDLKKVLKGCDAEEQVIESCDSDHGCGDGRCVDACLSAELSKGSAGCSFWTLPPDAGPVGRGSCFAAMIANTWDRPVTIGAELDRSPLDISSSVYTATKSGSETIYSRLEGPIPPGQVALVFLSQGPSAGQTREYTPCPLGITPALKEDPAKRGTVRSRAFHLTANAPVSAYSIYPYGGALSYFPSSTLLLPVSSWGTNYVAVSAGVFKMSVGPYSPGIGNAFLQIVASEDDTEVRMRARADLLDGAGVPGMASGSSQSWTLARGEVVQIGQLDDLSGSPIETTKPVGLFGGTECTNLPDKYPACDALHQQIPPLAQWGSEYALVPYRSRINDDDDVREPVLYRVVGAVDGTTLTYDPARPLDAPETLNAGQAVFFLSKEHVIVRSQGKSHPFYAGVYMTGAVFNGSIVGNGEVSTYGATLGDPDFVNVVPSDQYLDRYVFFADYTYPETTLTVVRRKTRTGFAPVELDCAGELTGFRPLGTDGTYEHAWVRLTTGSVPQPFPRGSCGYGRHEAKSDGPFSVTVWGIGEAASYGYAGGMGSRPINDVKAPVLK